MKKCGFIFLLALVAAASAKAQRDNKPWSIGFGLEAGTPLGTTGNGYTVTGGATLRFSYKLGPGFATISSGARLYYPKKVTGEQTKAALQIPVMAGYKYIFMKHLFVMGELGYSSFRYYYGDGNGGLAHSSTSGFTYAPSAGVQFGAFEAGVKYEGIALSGGTLSDLSLRLGFNF